MGLLNVRIVAVVGPWRVCRTSKGVCLDAAGDSIGVVRLLQRGLSSL